MPLVLFIRARLSPYDLVWIGTGDALTTPARLEATSPVPLELVGATDYDLRAVRNHAAAYREHHAWHRATPDFVELLRGWITLDAKDLVPAERMLTVREVAARLGVTPITVRRRIAAGKLPCIQIGRQIRFDPVELAKL